MSTQEGKSNSGDKAFTCPDTDSVCVAGCGRPAMCVRLAGRMTLLTSQGGKSNTVEYRLTWESVDPHFAAAMEEQYGKDVWPKFSENQWAEMPWRPPTQRIATGGDIFDQRNALQRCAESHEQPIRNVRFEQRPIPSPDEGWEAVR